MEDYMLLIYWTDGEVSKYKSISDFMYGRESYNNVHMATELRIENGEIKATHWSVDDLVSYVADSEAYYAS